MPVRDCSEATSEASAIALLGEAKPAGRILAFGNDKIEPPVAHELRQPLVNHRPPAASDDIADKKDAHAVHAFRRSIVSFSVSTRSSCASKAVLGTVSIS